MSWREAQRRRNVMRQFTAPVHAIDDELPTGRSDGKFRPSNAGIVQLSEFLQYFIPVWCIRHLCNAGAEIERFRPFPVVRFGFGHAVSRVVDGYTKTSASSERKGPRPRATDLCGRKRRPSVHVGAMDRTVRERPRSTRLRCWQEPVARSCGRS